MPSKPRPASNNVIACLEDIIAAVSDALPAVAAASDRAADRYQDPVLLAHLVRIERALNAVGAHARNARHNQYEPRRVT